MASYVYKMGVILGLLVLVLSAFGISSGSKRGIMSPVEVLDRPVPEVLYLGALWLLYLIYDIFSSRSTDYFLFCDSLASLYTSYAVIDTVYAVVLFISVSRCFRLSSGPKTSDDDPEESSWLSFVLGAVHDKAQRSVPKVILATCVAFLPSALCCVFLWQYMFETRIGNQAEESYCLAGQKDVAMASIQISKVLLEIISVVIYAFGPQRGPWRRTALKIAMLCSWILFAFMLPPHGRYKPHGISTVIPRLYNTDLATDFVEITHITVVALLGILEPFRT